MEERVFTLWAGYTPRVKRWENTARYKRERPNKGRQSVPGAHETHVPEAGTEIPPASAGQEEPTDRLRGLCEKEKQGKGGEREQLLKGHDTRHCRV